MTKFKKIALFAGAAGMALIGVSLASSHSAALAPTDQKAFINAAESTINGVVSVKSFATPRMNYSQGGGDFFNDPFFEYFFGQPRGRQPQQQQPQQQERQTGLGSGVIISADGYIVTNNHVIDGAERLEITLNDNRNFEATVIGADPNTDLALLKIEADGLHVIPIGDSEDLHVGEWVLAVGNPFGFTSTVTSGIVSAKGRNISSMSGGSRAGNIESYIQTDAALNAGNSGGALVNLDGELVGINTAIYSQTGNYAGCSFAIPTSIVNKVVGDLKQYGAVQRAVLGVRIAELTPELVKEKKIDGVNAGIYVAGVEDGSAAQEGGLAEGDVIISINDHKTPTFALLQEALAKCSPGDVVKVEFIRDGKTMQKKVTMRNGKGNTSITRAGNVSDLGCNFAPLSKEKKSRLRISNGVEVKDIENGPMKAAGISEGFVVVEINDTPVTKAEDVEKLYNAVMKDDQADKVFVIKGVTPTGKVKYYVVELAE
ncbi:MAG: Do family serine endopeptidase [Muribaculaceae bacterium]|nr:Do family serine endopeptidase [Muribaculaceae bacterium]